MREPAMAESQSTVRPTPKQPEGKSGVYRIRCVPTGRAYVGSSIDIKDRWRWHRRDLRAGRHQNAKLQNAWRKHGAEAFVFEILELSPIDDLIAREQYFIDSLGAHYKQGGFNLRAKADSNLGLLKSPATRRKISETKKAHYTKDPECREKTLAALSLCQTPEARAKRKAFLASPSEKERMKAAMSKRSRVCWADPECRARLTEATRQRAVAQAADPEYRAKMSATIKAKYASDPEWAARRAAASKEAKRRKRESQGG
jgi:group I intron endonuclease